MELSSFRLPRWASDLEWPCKLKQGWDEAGCPDHSAGCVWDRCRGEAQAGCPDHSVGCVWDRGAGVRQRCRGETQAGCPDHNAGCVWDRDAEEQLMETNTDLSCQKKVGKPWGKYPALSEATSIQGLLSTGTLNRPGDSVGTLRSSRQGKAGQVTRNLREEPECPPLARSQSPLLPSTISGS